MPTREFRYHLLSIGANHPPDARPAAGGRDTNGSSVRAAERDAFGISWTFAQLGYWRAERNRCLTGAQVTDSAVDAHLAYCAGIPDLDLLFIYWSGHVHSTDALMQALTDVPGARLRVLIIDTCQADDRMRRLDAAVASLPDDRRPVTLLSCAPDPRARENSLHGFFTGALLRQLRRPRRAGVRSLDLLDAFNRAADDAVARIGREPSFTSNGAGRLRIPILAQTDLPF